MPAPGAWISRCQVLCARWQERWVKGASLKRSFKMQFRIAYYRSLVYSSPKLWPKSNSGNSVPCILPCKIGGSWNLMKEQYLSKTPCLTFVYLSKCNIKLPGYFGNSKKRFLWTSLMQMINVLLFWNCELKEGLTVFRYALKKKRYYLGIFPKRRTPPPTPLFWEPLIQKNFLVFILHFRT